MVHDGFISYSLYMEVDKRRRVVQGEGHGATRSMENQPKLSDAYHDEPEVGTFFARLLAAYIMPLARSILMPRGYSALGRRLVLGGTESGGLGTAEFRLAMLLEVRPRHSPARRPPTNRG